MDIARHFLPAGVVFDHHGLEPALKQVTGPVMPPIEPDAVADAQPLHRPAQVGSWSFHQEVQMIVHQHIGMNSDTKPLSCLAEQLQEMSAVGVVAVDGFAFVAPDRYVITSPWPFDAQRAS